MIELNHPKLSVRNQCELLGFNRSTLYHQPKYSLTSDTNLANELHDLWIEMPFYGYRRITIVQQNLVSHPNIFSSLLPKPLAEQLVNLSQTTRKSRNWISPFSLRQIVEDYFRFYRQFSLRVEIPA